MSDERQLSEEDILAVVQEHPDLFEIEEDENGETLIRLRVGADVSRAFPPGDLLGGGPAPA